MTSDHALKAHFVFILAMTGGRNEYKNVFKSEPNCRSNFRSTFNRLFSQKGCCFSPPAMAEGSQALWGKVSPSNVNCKARGQSPQTHTRVHNTCSLRQCARTPTTQPHFAENKPLRHVSGQDALHHLRHLSRQNLRSVGAQERGH